MLKIGEFSRLSRISIRMLRDYDEIGLLKPELVDEFTGYRYYVESQLLPASLSIFIMSASLRRRTLRIV